MRQCRNCRWGDPAKDQDGTTFYFCRWLPPRADGTVPAMKPIGYCGQFKLAFFRWLKNFAHPAI